MSLASRRRLLLPIVESGGQDTSDRLILWENFSPATTFQNDTSVDKAVYDLRSNATFFADFTLSEAPSDTRYIISLGGNDISTANGSNNGYPRSCIHLRYNNGTPQISSSMRWLSTLNAKTKTVTATGIKIGRNTLFINQNIVILNGNSLQTALANYQSETVDVIYSTGGAVKIGEMASNPPTGIRFNEISIIKRLLTASDVDANGLRETI